MRRGTWLKGGNSRKRRWALGQFLDPSLGYIVQAIWWPCTFHTLTPIHRAVAGPFFLLNRTQPLSCCPSPGPQRPPPLPSCPKVLCTRLPLDHWLALPWASCSGMQGSLQTPMSSLAQPSVFPEGKAGHRCIWNQPPWEEGFFRHHQDLLFNSLIWVPNITPL